MKTFIFVLFCLLVSLNVIGSAQPTRGFQRTWNHPFEMRRGPMVHCAPEVLMIYQDCRMCVCPRPNRVAKCFKKSCDLRTKDSGQCPSAVLRVGDGKTCNILSNVGPRCNIDADCPGIQLCCFDFCGGSNCVNPAPLDAISGQPIHHGRGYQ